MASVPEVPVESAASQWGSEVSTLLVRKMLCRSKPRDQQIVSLPHEHHDDHDDDGLPNLCQHYRGRATMGSVRGERRHTLPTLRWRLLPCPRTPSRVLHSQPFSISCQSSGYMVEWPQRPPPSRWTLADSMARSPTVSKSRPVPLIKSPKMDMMRYERSSVTRAIKNKLHRSLVAQVPANATRSKSQQHCSTSPPTCCSLKAYPNCAFASHAAEESISWQHLDVAQRPPNRSRLQHDASKPTVAAPRRVASHHRVLS